MLAWFAEREKREGGEARWVDDACRALLFSR